MAKYVDFVRANPGMTTNEIAAVFSRPPKMMSSALCNERRVGRLTSEEVETNRHKQLRWYFQTDKATYPVQAKTAMPEPKVVTPIPATAPIPDETPESVSTGLSLDNIVALIASNLATEIANRVVTLLNGHLQTKLNKALLPKMEVKMRKPKLCIAGLLPQQAGMISSEFASVFDLYFWKNEEPRKLKEYASSCEAVFTVTDFIGHDTENLIKSVNGNLIRVSGGMTRLRETLTNYWVETTDER